MNKYIAIGIAQYNDSKDAIKIFKADSQYDARHYIINHFDSSLNWTFTESTNYLKGV